MALVPLATAEIGRVSQVMPVAFRVQHGRWQAVGVMGPAEGTNVYVGCDGRWRGSFVPATLRVYPFRLDGAGELALWDRYSPEPLAANDVAPFFAGAGWSARVAQTGQFLESVHAGIVAAARVLEDLDRLGLLLPWEVPGLDKRRPDIALRGLHVLDVDALGRLAGEALLSLFRSGALLWLHAHAESLHHAQRFKAMAEVLVAPQLEAPPKTEPIEGAADILAAIAADPGDTEL